MAIARTGALPLVCLLAIAGCSSKKSARDCTRDVAKLEAWVAILRAEGSAIVPSQRNLTPVVVADVAPATPPLLPVVMLTADEITLGGRLLTTHDRIDADGLRLALTELRAAMAEDAAELAVLADATVPWRSIAAVGQGATAAGFSRLRFVFRGVSKLTEPAPSWLDAELGPLHDEVDPPTPDLDAAMKRANDPTRKRLFSGCPSGRAFLERTLSSSDETASAGALVVAGITDAFRACECTEDLAAVQRWLWAMSHREQNNMPHASVVVTLSAAAPALAVDPQAPWSEAHKAILALAGDPVRF